MQSKSRNVKKGSNIAGVRLAHAKRSYATKVVRVCPLHAHSDKDINYKNLPVLKKFVSDYGRILPSRITSTAARKQRKLAVAIKIARYMALMPYHGIL